MLDREYNRTEWTHVYTDGSAEDAVRNGGSGIYIRFPDGRCHTQSLPSGKLSTNYRAEQLALLEAASHLNTTDTAGTHVVFLTDCRSALEKNSKTSRGQYHQETTTGYCRTLPEMHGSSTMDPLPL